MKERIKKWYEENKTKVDDVAITAAVTTVSLSAVAFVWYKLGVRDGEQHLKVTKLASWTNTDTDEKILEIRHNNGFSTWFDFEPDINLWPEVSEEAS